jgi:hypothetical protein
MSVSVGGPGATLNFGSKGVRGTVGLPGTGLSYSHQFGKSAAKGSDYPELQTWTPLPDAPAPNAPAEPEPLTGNREIRSAAIERLTSTSLVGLQKLLTDARRQRQQLVADLKIAQARFAADGERLSKRQSSIFRRLYRKSIAQLEASQPELAADIEELNAWLEASHINISFDTDLAAAKAWDAVVFAFDQMARASVVWDLVSTAKVNRAAARSNVDSSVKRLPVRIGYDQSDLVRFEGRALAFGNANGADLLILPGMILMVRGDGTIGLIDIRDIAVTFADITFNEPEQVPRDAESRGTTWAKVNKNGTQDLRFKDNHTVPVVGYGGMTFNSATGLDEQWMLSLVEPVREFCHRLSDYQRALPDEVAS